MCMKVKVTQSCPALCNTVDCTSPWNSPGHNTGVGSHYLLQGIFPPRDRIQVSHNAGGFFTSWATREAPITCMYVCVCVCVCVCVYHIFFIHWSVNGNWDWLYVLAIAYSEAMNIDVHISFWIRVFIFSKYMLSSEIAGSYGSSVVNFLRNLSTAFHSNCTNLLYIPTCSAEAFPFLQPSPAFIVCRFFWWWS